MWMLVLVVLIACGPRKPPAIVVDDPADLDEETLNALVAELVPLVEEAADRPFPEVPHARLSRRSDMEAILESEFLDLTGDAYEAPDWVIRQLAEEARAGAPSIVGKWGLQTGVLYLSPDAVAEVTAGVGLPVEEMGSVARLVLAHEMVHGLQADLVTWKGLADMDHIDAVRGVTEGHANFVEQRISERLGLEPARRALDTAQGWDDDGPKSALAFETWALYGQGKAFVAWHEAHGGSQAAWKVVHEPPSATSMLFRPETYSPEVAPHEDFSAALDGVEGLLTEGSWVAVAGRAGELALRQELFGAPQAEVDAALGALVAGTQREAFRSDRRALLRVLRFRDAEAALAMVHLATRPTTMPLPPDAPEIVDEITPYEGVEADLAVQHVKGLPTLGVAYERTEVWVARGDLVVEVRAEAFRPGIRMREAVQTLLSRL